MTLAERVAASDPGPLIQRFLAETAFSAATSDERFIRVLAALSPQSTTTPRSREIWLTPVGQEAARVERGSIRFTLTIDERIAPAFGDYLFSKLDELYVAFRREQ